VSVLLDAAREAGGGAFALAFLFAAVFLLAEWLQP
jgi:hypothetical protein